MEEKTKQNDKITIQECSPLDVESVGEFYDGVVKYLTEHVNYPKWMYREYPSEPFVRDMVEAHSQYVCRIDGKIVAAFAINDDPEREYRNVKFSKVVAHGEYLTIHALAVATELQGQGIGKQIVQFCIDFAQAHGYKAIRLDVVPGNFPAKKLYERCGFQYLGDVDLGRGYEHIPLFSMYELNL
ncbi:MAG: GNAT family N-acetyltransferase [Clostridiales bacterium]|nr:GNAT family N-acetyltransferase [Clostridiales bacterium]